MAPLFRGLTTVLVSAALAGCVASSPQVVTAPPAKPAPQPEPAVNAEIAELEAGFAELRDKQDVMFQMMTVLMQEATQPELLAALRQTAERMKTATQDIDGFQ